MAKRRGGQSDKLSAQGSCLLRRVLPLLKQIADNSAERDKAGNRRLGYAQYAALVLVGLFNPVLTSARALVAASGTKGVRKLTGGGKVSLGSFSEAASVFDPELLAPPLIDKFKQELRDKRSREWLEAGHAVTDSPQTSSLAERLTAVDATVLSTLPGLASDSARMKRWRMHVALKVQDAVVEEWRLTEEPSRPGRSERDQAGAMLPQEQAGLYLLDRGYRSAGLFNQIVAAGGDYVARANRNEGRSVGEPAELSAAALALGVVADELITYGGSRSERVDHPLRRVTLVPPANRPSAARQGRPRTDQTGRDELVLFTTLLDVPAEGVVALYEQRWTIELFFRFLKHTLGCQKLLSTKTQGVQIQLYCALIAALLLALACGRSITKRQFEMVCLRLAGWADDEDLAQAFGLPPP
jgi:hypothetical protein